MRLSWHFIFARPFARRPRDEQLVELKDKKATPTPVAPRSKYSIKKQEKRDGENQLNIAPTSGLS